jgi:hypothetical protein
MVCEWFGLKITQTVFAGLTSKPVTTVSWFGPQNQAGFGCATEPTEGGWRGTRVEI